MSRSRRAFLFQEPPSCLNTFDLIGAPLSSRCGRGVRRQRLPGRLRDSRNQAAAGCSRRSTCWSSGCRTAPGCLPGATTEGPTTTATWTSCGRRWEGGQGWAGQIRVWPGGSGSSPRGAPWESTAASSAARVVLAGSGEEESYAFGTGAGEAASAASGMGAAGSLDSGKCFLAARTEGTVATAAAADTPRPGWAGQRQRSRTFAGSIRSRGASTRYWQRCWSGRPG